MYSGRFHSFFLMFGVVLVAVFPRLGGPCGSVFAFAEPAEEVIYRNNRGTALLDQYKFKEAIAEFRAVVEKYPDVTPGWVNLGIAYFYDQRYNEAIEAFQEALKREPDEPHAHYVLGLIYRNQDEIDQAVKAFEKVYRADPNDASTAYYLGQLYMRLRDYAQAADYFRRVISLEPYNASAHYNLATALGRGGDREAGRREMEEFRRLQNLFGSTTVGLQYLEQGKYAIAIQRIPAEYLPGSPPAAAPAVSVRFEDVAAVSGLTFRHQGPGRLNRHFDSTQALEQEVVPAFGSGVSFVDYDLDGRMDLYFANAGSGGAVGALFRNRGDGVFEERTEGAGLIGRGQTMQACWGDFDNDGAPDLYLANYGPNVLYRNQGNGTFENVTEALGVGDDNWSMGCAFVDFDHDGDLDLVVANLAERPKGASVQGEAPNVLTAAGNRLFRNNGNGTFTDVAKDARLDQPGLRSVGIITADFDDSRDVDFLLLDLSGDHRLLSNLRDGSFRAQEVPWTGRAAGPGAATGDLNGDGLLDFVFGAADGGITIWRNLGYNRYDPKVVPGTEALGRDLVPLLLDYDNDGDLDLLVVSVALGKSSGAEESGKVYLFQNRDGDFVDVTKAVGLDRVSGRPLRGVSTADFDGDGDLDLVLATNGGAPWLLRNDGGNQNQWIAVRPVGTNSNKPGYGVKAELKAGALWAKRETMGGQGFLTQSPAVFHFGLGQRRQADVIRLLWPNGVLQSEIDQPARQNLEISELDRKGTSCPIMYVWDGRTYRFQTDFLGGGAYGSLVAPGIYNYPDTDEYIKLNRDDVALRDGRVAITMNNQLEEVILYDHVQLVVVDHPAEYEVFPDEKLLPGPPYDPFRLITAQDLRLPRAVWDHAGRNVLEEVAAVDRRYPEVPGDLPFKGYAEEHSLVLDLGDVDPEHVVLLLYAWIDYADSTSNLAASQAGLAQIPPYVQVRDASGRWVTVLERMGFPAGLPKTMTVDLSGRFLSPSREVRIVTNMKIYWDQILVATGRPRDDYRLFRIPASGAELRYHGFPRPYSPDGRLPHAYIYGELVQPEWKVHVGAYTRYGDVLPLLQEADDMFVITRSGDEVAVEFDVSDLPSLPPGWTRDYLVYVDGFGKDMDPNSAGPHFLGPLPSHRMTAYPYPPGESYPDTPEHREYLERWNTRIFDQAIPPLAASPAEE